MLFRSCQMERLLYQVQFAKQEQLLSAQRAAQVTLGLERYENLAKNQPALIQRTPQIYLANYLGITPQSLSRLRRNIVTNHG